MAATVEPALTDQPLITALDDFPTILALTDGDNRFVRINQAAARFLGRDREEVVGHRVTEFLTPSCAAEVEEMARDPAIDAGTYGTHEWSFMRPDGTVVWGNVQTIRLKDASGRTTARVSIVEDVTAARSVARDQAVLQDRVRHFQMLFERGSLGQLTLAFPSLVITAVNSALCDMTGYTEDELVGHSVDVIFPADRNPSGETLERLADGSSDGYSNERVLLRCDGTVIPVMSTVCAVRRAEGPPDELFVMMQDLSEQRRVQEAALRSEALIDSAIAALPVTFSAFDRDMRFTYVAGGLSRMGMRPEDYIGKHVSEVTAEPAVFAAMQRALDGFESTTRTRRGDETYMTAHGPIRDSDGEVVGIVAVTTNVTAEVRAELERRRAEEAILFAVRHDPLTGVFARPALIEHLTRLDAASFARTALVLMDLDDFRMINDGLGHEVGDLVLIEVASRLRDMFPGSVVARVGGDDFAVAITPDEDGAAGDLPLRVQAALTAHLGIGADELEVSACAGIALGSTARSSALLMANADAALVNAKDAGTGQVRVFDAEMHEAITTRLQLRRGLRSARSRDQFRLLYQPIVNLGSRRMIGAEALLRWMHPERGMVPPNSFIPIAEQTGLIVDIGAWVLGTACADAAHMQAAGAPYVAVNVSARQLDDRAFNELVEQVLANTGLPATALVVEVTESALMDDVAVLSATFKRLQRIGVRVALDDFGTGYSSLARLQRIPVDIVKLDRAFVTKIESRPEASRIAAAVLQMTSAIGAAVVAEGIESEAEARTLVDLGYATGQGYLFGRPMPLAALRLRLSRVSAVAMSRCGGAVEQVPALARMRGQARAGTSASA